MRHPTIYTVTSNTLIDKQVEAAKEVAKILRKAGIRTAVLRGNGTTSTLGSKPYDAYFAIERTDDWGSHASNPVIYLNFKMNGKTGKAIKEALDKAGGFYVWEGNDFSAFRFVVDVVRGGLCGI